jgi:GntR family transcriptional regulator, transcriptional repressor for pyruvate dehydrogenase complex
VDGPKAADVLVRELRAQIVAGQLAAGSVLPTERELVVQTGTSRTTVREALRILETQGLLQIRAGRAGGAFVRQPNSDLVTDSVSLLIQGRKIRLDSLLEAREAMEPICAQLAAANRTDTDLAAMNAANAIVGDPSIALPDYLQANVDWHLAVAAATHNEILSAFMAALSQAIYSSTENAQFVDDKIRVLSAKAHSAVMDSIAARDSAAAGRRMKRHIHLYAEAILAVEERTEVLLADDRYGGVSSAR